MVRFENLTMQELMILTKVRYITGYENMSSTAQKIINGKLRFLCSDRYGLIFQGIF